MKKFIPPILISVLMLLSMGAYTVLYLFVFRQIERPWLSLGLSILTLAALFFLAAAMIRTLRIRIKEIQEENEDDYRKY